MVTFINLQLASIYWNWIYVIPVIFVRPEVLGGVCPVGRVSGAFSASPELRPTALPHRAALPSERELHNPCLCQSLGVPRLKDCLGTGNIRETVTRVIIPRHALN